MFWKKKQKPTIPKDAFKLPLKHRFTFVAEGWTYFGGFTVQLSDKFSSKKKAFFLASCLFLDKYPEFTNKPVAVYYGDVEAPDCKDRLYGAYNIFDKGRRK